MTPARAQTRRSSHDMSLPHLACLAEAPIGCGGSKHEGELGSRASAVVTSDAAIRMLLAAPRLHWPPSAVSCRRHGSESGACAYCACRSCTSERQRAGAARRSWATAYGRTLARVRACWPSLPLRCRGALREPAARGWRLGRRNVCSCVTVRCRMPAAGAACCLPARPRAASSDDLVPSCALLAPAQMWGSATLAIGRASRRTCWRQKVSEAWRIRRRSHSRVPSALQRRLSLCRTGMRHDASGHAAAEADRVEGTDTRPQPSGDMRSERRV
jgi:hypothetical protein